MKKELTITLFCSELIYDIQNKTYLTGRSRLSQDNFEETANMQANDDEENRNQIVRSISNAFALMKVKMSEYIVDAGTTASNILQEMDSSTKLQLQLRMPSNYNETTRETLASAAHQYIVNIAIADWFGITNKNDAAEYLATAKANIVEMREAVNKRVRPHRAEL